MVNPNPYDILTAATEELKAAKAEQVQINAMQEALDARVSEAYRQLKAAALLIAANPEISRPERRSPSTTPTPARSKVETLMALMKSRPSADNGWLASQLYGEVTKQTRSRTASLLSYLKGKQLIDKVEDLWVVHSE